MNFTFTDEQLSFGAAVREVLRDHCHPSERGSGWKQLAELGFFAALVDEEAGGLGLSLIDVIPALEETGRAAVPGPIVETLSAAPHVALAGRAGALPLAGRIGVVVDGVALDADLAEVLVDAAGVALVDPVLEPLAGMDPGRVPFAVRASGGVPFALSAAGPEETGVVLRRVTVGVSAQLVGVARELLARSVDYAKARTQFGRPIGAFQAVKHQLADVAIAVEFAAPLVYRAALSVDHAVSRVGSDRAVSRAERDRAVSSLGRAVSGVERHRAVSRVERADLGVERDRAVSSGERAVSGVERDVSAAKVAAGEAAALAARVALQVHGAIGYTDELDLRFWLARTWSLTAAYGTTAAHRARVTEAVFGR
ncbi:acyl-CoA dehydrogenase family protein [Nonomuraea sp. NPDC059194]|uniref:acyl-CoA dehydrogenase family protein n=1 Tax=Nonomuraea sp. NPDC059194 TaxID=3346764 RepID=UPI0036A2B2F9